MLMESKPLQLPSFGLSLITIPFGVYGFKICWLDGSFEAGDKLDFFKECLSPHSEQALEALMIGRQVFAGSQPLFLQRNCLPEFRISSSKPEHKADIWKPQST